MPAKTDSYGTTIGSSFNTSGLVRTIREAVITDDLDERRESAQGIKAIGGFHPLLITGSYPSEGKIPKFPHPISILGIRNKNFICSDLRSVLKENTGGRFEDRIRNHQDYEAILTRQRLTMFWLGGRAAEFRTSLRFGAYAFATWLSDAVGHLKGLDKHQKLVSLIVFLCYYCDLTHDSETQDDRMYRVGMIPWVDSFVTFPDVESVLLKIGNAPMRNIDDAVERVKTVIDTPMLTNLTAGALMQAVRNSWFGNGVDAQVMVGVALEDPPTWCSMVYSALIYSGYKNSMIAQVALRLGKNGEQQAFENTIQNTINDTLRMESVASIISPLPEEFEKGKCDTKDLIFRAESTYDVSDLLKKE